MIRGWSRSGRESPILGLPVSEHPMLPTFADQMPGYALPIRVGFPFDTTLCVTRMIYGGVFERHPGLEFIVPHTGSAFIGLLERLDHGFHLFHECREHITQLPSVFARKNLYYDTCSFSKRFIEMAIDEIGEDRFLFGTDYPYIVADPSYIDAPRFVGGSERENLQRQCRAAVRKASWISRCRVTCRTASGVRKPGLAYSPPLRSRNARVIVEYRGRRIPTKEARKYERRRASKYMFEIDGRWTIDGSTRRNTARYANHSCRPNAESALVAGKIVLRAIKPIRAGDEITFDYGREYFDLFLKAKGCKCTKCRTR